jgi:hypothetical protein
MEMGFLPVFGGILSSIIGGILKIILTPIMELVGFLLRTIVGPLLEAVLVPVAEFVLELIFDVLSGVFYTILKSLLTIVEVIEGSFKTFSGIGSVRYKGSDTTLLDVFLFENTALTRSFWSITVLCLLLSLIFALYAVTRSTLDFDFENKRSVGKILGSMGKAGISFLLLPFLLLFAVRLTNVVMVQVYNITTTESITVADTIFQIAAMDANLNSAENLSETQSFTSGMRAQFNNGGWKNIDLVKSKFDLSEIDYVIGYGVGIFMLITFVTIAFTFVQRIFEIMLMYIAAPFFVSTMPLDDGQKYSAWREMFIGKLVSGMGMIVLMNLYLMAVPIIMNPNMRLDPRATDSSYLTYDYLMKMVFVLGGALAVKNGGSLITSIVSYQAGMQEQQTVQQTGDMVTRTALVAGGVALAVGKLTGKAAWQPLRFAGKGAQYALTKQMMEGDPNSKTTKLLRGGYQAAGMVKRAWANDKNRISSLARGDVAGMFKRDGKDTYTSKRIGSFLSGNMVDFMQTSKDKARYEAKTAKRDNKMEGRIKPWETYNAQPPPAPQALGGSGAPSTSTPPGGGITRPRSNALPPTPGGRSPLSGDSVPSRPRSNSLPPTPSGGSGGAPSPRPRSNSLPPVPSGGTNNSPPRRGGSGSADDPPRH